MSTRKRNQWLEIEEDQDDTVYFSASEGSDNEERGKSQIKSRSIKRRRIDDHLSGSENDYSDEEPLDKSKAGAGAVTAAPKPVAPETTDSRFARFDDDDDEEERDQESLVATAPSPEEQEDEALSAAKLKSKAKAKKKSGVIYLSRIPPFMKPQTVRSFLEPYGEIGKLFLTPEDDSTYTRRVKSGGNKKKSYIDGWVEFKSKNDAKTVAQMLNGNIMGGKKGNYYHDDIWNIKYLKGFKWDDLTEQISRENKEREARLRAEITKSKRENEGFLRDLERGKIQDTMDTRRKERGGAAKDTQPERKFKQKPARETRTAAPKANDTASRVLSSLL